MEAAYLGKPTLSIIPKEGEEDWCPSVLNKITPCAYDTEQIIKELNSYKKNDIVEIKFDKKNTISKIIKSLLKSF